MPGLISLDFCCDIHLVGSEFDINNMKAWIYPALYTLCPLVLTEHWLNATVLPEYCCRVYLYDHSLSSSDGLFQQDNKDQIRSSKSSDQFTKLKRPPQSPDLNPVEHLWDVLEQEIHIMDVQTTNLQQL